MNFKKSTDRTVYGELRKANICLPRRRDDLTLAEKFDRQLFERSHCQYGKKRSIAARGDVVQGA